MVRVRRRRHRDRDRPHAHGRLAARIASLPERGPRLERAALRQRPRRLLRRARRAARRRGPATRDGDSIAALFVAVLVLVAAGRLMRGNVDVLMDRVPADAESAARAAISAVKPAVELRRLRMRQAAGRQFADVVIGVPPDRGGGAGARSRRRGRGGGRSRAARRRRRRPRRADRGRRRPRASPRGRARRPPRARGAQHRARRRRRSHGAVTPREASRRPVARGGARDRRAARGVDLRRGPRDPGRADAPRAARRRAGRASEVSGSGEAVVRRIVHDVHRVANRARSASCAPTAGSSPSSRSRLAGTSRLDEAHARASEIEEQIRLARPDIADVIVHTEP